jgi:hypothetical protein
MQYADFLEEMLPLLLENVPPHVCKSMWYQDNGVPPHFASQVHNWLDDFLDRWIEHGGTITWLPHSPDLIVQDFHVWGCMKGKVYAMEVEVCVQVEGRHFEYLL